MGFLVVPVKYGPKTPRGVWQVLYILYPPPWEAPQPGGVGGAPPGGPWGPRPPPGVDTPDDPFGAGGQTQHGHMTHVMSPPKTPYRNTPTNLSLITLTLSLVRLLPPSHLRKGILLRTDQMGVSCGTGQIWPQNAPGGLAGAIYIISPSLGPPPAGGGGGGPPWGPLGAKAPPWGRYPR